MSLSALQLNSDPVAVVHRLESTIGVALVQRAATCAAMASRHHALHVGTNLPYTWGLSNQRCTTYTYAGMVLPAGSGSPSLA